MYYVNYFGGFLWEEIIQDFGGGHTLSYHGYMKYLIHIYFLLKADKLNVSCCIYCFKFAELYYLVLICSFIGCSFDYLPLANLRKTRKRWSWISRILGR